MKDLISLFKKPFVALVVGLLLTATIAGGIGYFFVLPQLNLLSENQKKTAALTDQLDTLTKNINTIQSLDQEEIAGFTKTLDNFYPEVIDSLHFATLNDSLAFTVGLKVTSFTISALPKTLTPAASAGGSIGTSTPKTTTTTPIPNDATAKTTPPPGYSVVVSYSGSYEKMASLFSNLHSLDRLVGVNHVTFNQVSTGLTVSVTYFLPVSVAKSSATSTNLVLLNAGDRSLLNTLAKSVVFTASPAHMPLGKTNPFQ